MTTVTEEGTTYLLDRITSNTRPITHIAIGTGSNETGTATQLGNLLYSGDDSLPNVRFVQPNTDTLEAVITVTGGVQVAAGTEISEVGVFSGDPEDSTVDETLVFIDGFSSVQVDPGHTEEFTVPLDVPIQ
jgi:hypothetical protein